MARSEPRRINTGVSQPTLTGADTFVRASTGVDASKGAVDIGAALLKAAPSLAQFAKENADDKNVQTAKVADAVGTLMNADPKLTLAQAVAKYTASGDTPRQLRARATRMMKDGKITFFQNPFSRRAYGERVAQHRIGEAKKRSIKFLPEIIKAQDAAMLATDATAEDAQAAGDARAIELMSGLDDLYEGIGGDYGATILRQGITEVVQNVSTLAFAQFEEQAQAQITEGIVREMLDDVEFDKDIADSSTNNPDYNIKDEFKEYPQKIGEMADNLKHNVPLTWKTDTLATITTMIEKTAKMKDPIDRQEAIDLIENAAETARRGSGDKVFSDTSTEMGKIRSLAASARRKAQADERYGSERTAKANAMWVTAREEDWYGIPDSQQSEKQRERRKEWVEGVDDDIARLIEGYYEQNNANREREFKLREGSRDEATQPSPSQRSRFDAMQADPREVARAFRDVSLNPSINFLNTYITSNDALGFTEDQRSDVLQMFFALRKKNRNFVQTIDSRLEEVVTRGLKGEQLIEFDPTDDLGEARLSSAPSNYEANDKADDIAAIFRDQVLPGIRRGLDTGELEESEVGAIIRSESRRILNELIPAKAADIREASESVEKQVSLILEDLDQEDLNARYTGRGPELISREEEHPTDRRDFAREVTDLQGVTFNKNLKREMSLSLFNNVNQEEGEGTTLAELGMTAAEVTAATERMSKWVDSEARRFFDIDPTAQDADILGAEFEAHLRREFTDPLFFVTRRNGQVVGREEKKAFGPKLNTGNLIREMAKTNPLFIFDEENNEVRINVDLIPLTTITPPKEADKEHIKLMTGHFRGLEDNRFKEYNRLMTNGYGIQGETISNIGNYILAAPADSRSAGEMKRDILDDISGTRNPILKKTWETALDMVQKRQHIEFDWDNRDHRLLIAPYFNHFFLLDGRRRPSKEAMKPEKTQ